MSWSPPADYTTRPVVVLGGGVLGRRIAACWVSAGWHVIIRDPSEKSRADAVDYIQKNISTYVGLSRGRQGTFEATEDLSTAVEKAWLVFEAVPEILELKESTFQVLEKFAPQDCILGSNSSSYKSSELLAKIGASTKKRVLNTHYMMPPQALIVELMTSGQTSEDIFPFLAKEHAKCGLHPVVANKESTGFVFNRIWAAIKREVLAVIAEGVAEPETIDKIWKEMYQSPVGPCSMMDSVGLDTVEHIEQHYVKDRRLHSDTVDWLHRNYIEKGKLDNKSDKGGLYPPPMQGHGSKIIVLNLMNRGDYPGEIPLSEATSGGQIVEVTVENKNVTHSTLVTGQHSPDGIDVSDENARMYWTTMGVPKDNDGAVYSARLDGSDIQTVVPVGSVHTPKQLHIDQQSRKLYFCDREGLRIHRCNFDGSQHEIVVQNGNWRTEPEKVEDQTQWPVGITISQKLQKLFWTQKGGSKAGRGRIFSAAIDIPKGSNANNRQDIAVVSDGLPEPIDLDFDDDNGILYWTDRGEVPLGNTLNKKTLIGPARDAEKALDREIIAQGFAEAIGLRLDKARQRIYVTDLSGSLWECMTEPGPKTKIYERAGHSYTGLAIVKY